MGTNRAMLCRLKAGLCCLCGITLCLVTVGIWAQGDGPVQAPLPSYEAEGDMLMAHQRYQAAIAAYKQAPVSSTVLNKLGIADQQMYLMDDARKVYEQALKLNGHASEIWNNLGTVFYAQHSYGSAERSYKKALKLNPNSAIAAKNLGTLYMVEHKLAKGAEWYQTAMKLDPKVCDGVSPYRVGDPTSPQQLGAMNYYMARSFLVAGRLDKAIDYLRKSIDEGYTDGKRILADKQFATLKESPAFQLMLAEQDLSHGQRSMRGAVKN